MSKKTLLNETQVRRFMKLATLGRLSDGFVDGLSEAGYFEDITTEQEDELGDEPAMDDAGMDDLGGEEELPVDMEAGLDDELGDDPAMDDAAGESLPPDVVAKVETALADALGAMETALEEAIPELDLSVEQTDDLEGGEDLEGDLDAELAGDEGPEDLEADLGGEEGLEDEAPVEDELVERIVRRVAQRLRTNNKGSK